MLGLIVGSGFEHFELVDVKTKTVETPFGEVELDVGLMENKEVAQFRTVFKSRQKEE